MHHQRRPTLDGACDDADVLAARLGVRVDRRAGTDIGQVDRIREDRFHRARAGIVDKPLDLDACTEALLEPPLALARQPVRHQGLDMRDVREMSDPERDRVRRRGAAKHARRQQRRADQTSTLAQR